MSNFRNILKVVICTLKWIPVTFIVLIIAWSYFAYNFALCGYFIESAFEKVVLIALYHGFLFVFLWSYAQTTFSPLALPPDEFYLRAEEMQQFLELDSREDQSKLLERIAAERCLTVQCRDGAGLLRFCDICSCLKPDRSHHCSTCNECVLKMDHHCPWVNNCVGFHNYKFFVLFLFYGVLYCLYIVISSARHFVVYWQNQTRIDNHILGFNIVFLFLVAALFSIALLSLVSYHAYLVLRNRTTLESFRQPHFVSSDLDHSGKKNSFSLGMSGNARQIFGHDRRYWFLPVFSSKGDGVSFPNRFDSQPIVTRMSAFMAV